MANEGTGVDDDELVEVRAFGMGLLARVEVDDDRLRSLADDADNDGDAVERVERALLDATQRAQQSVRKAAQQNLVDGILKAK